MGDDYLTKEEVDWLTFLISILLLSFDVKLVALAICDRILRFATDGTLTPANELGFVINKPRKEIDNSFL